MEINRIPSIPLNNQKHPMQLILGALFATVGGGLLLISLWLVGANSYVLLTYDHAPGVVVSSDRIGPASGKGSTYSIQVRFEARRRAVTASPDRSFFAFDVGEPVSVYYRPDKPFQIQVNAFRTIWFAPTVSGVAGMILLVGAVGLFVRRMEPSQPGTQRQRQGAD